VGKYSFFFMKRTFSVGLPDEFGKKLLFDPGSWGRCMCSSKMVLSQGNVFAPGGDFI
jgi:hypothetical protein